MNPDSYTPGHTATALDFMARRSLATHAAFMTPLLQPGLRLLDCASWTAPAGRGI